MPEQIIPAYGDLAFESQLSPEGLYRVASVQPEEFEETRECLFGYAATLGDIRSLPEWRKP